MSGQSLHVPEASSAGESAARWAWLDSHRIEKQRRERITRSTETWMIKPWSSAVPSARARGALWLVAALLMFLGPVVFDGNGSAVAIGIVFLILGVTSLRKHESSDR
jgi:hypothetical protein